MTSTAALHIRAATLPGDGPIIDLWIVDGHVTLSPASNAVSIPGNYVAPGMVDAHCHLSLDFANSALPFHSEELVLYNAQRQVRAGVTAVRDAGFVKQLSPSHIAFPVRPVVQRSGWLIVPEGRYFPGEDVGTHTAPDHLVERVEQVANSGADWFKFIADFPGDDLDLFAAYLNYDLGEIREAVVAAHKAGLRVMAHTTGPAVDAIVEAGVDAIEHGMSVTPDTVALMAKHGTHWTPTAGTVDMFLAASEKAGGPTAPRTEWRDSMRASFASARQRGVDVLVGTDELAHGDIAGEIGVLIELGFDPDFALGAATTCARRVLGLPGIAEGVPADLVLWDEDPRQSPSTLASPVAVIAAGQLVDLEATLDAPGTDVPARVRYAQAPRTESCPLGIDLI